MQEFIVTLAPIISILITASIPVLIRSWVQSSRRTVDALQENTYAIIKLNMHIDEIFKKLEDLPEMRKDINEAHAKVRELSVKLNAIGESS